MSLFRKITETVSKGVSSATEKAQQTVEITRLHAQANGKRKEKEKRFAEIGQQVYLAYLKRDLSFSEQQVVSVCEQIAEIDRDLEALEQRMMELRNEKECECGRKVPYDTRYCPSCGFKFPEPVVAAPEPEPEMQEEPLLLAEPADEPPEPSAEAAESTACEYCGMPLRPDAAFCASCGSLQRSER